LDKEKENKLLKCKSLNEFSDMFFGYGINEQLSKKKNLKRYFRLNTGHEFYRRLLEEHMRLLVIIL
jgi:hypothetical protein